MAIVRGEKGRLRVKLESRARNEECVTSRERAFVWTRMSTASKLEQDRSRREGKEKRQTIVVVVY